ncbi:hypothetical protein ES703_20660 [subsurface metagenome]
MKTNAKSNTKKLVNGLNVMAEEESFNYKKAITKENEKIGLEARQKKVVASIMEDLNTKEGGNSEMAVNKGGVKQTTKAKVVKVVPPKEVDLKAVQEKCSGFLKGLETGLDSIKYELEKVHIGEISFKQNSRLIFGIRYRVCGNEVTYSLVTKETFKNFNKELQAHYAPGNWNVLFDFSNGNDIKKFNPIIQASLEKLKKAKEELPKKAKVKK